MTRILSAHGYVTGATSRVARRHPLVPLRHATSCTQVQALLTQAPGESMRSRRILVVEDNPDIAELLLHILGRSGYQVGHASNGEIALLMLTGELWDLVLTDLIMPVLDGSELVREMRTRPALAAIPVLMLTSIPEYLARMMLEHPISYLQKPFQSQVLLQCVLHLLEHP